MVQVGEVIAKLKAANPKVRDDYISLYASVYCDYVEADENIRKNGTIVLHPRTGQPMENPYVKLKSAATKQLASFNRVRSVSDLWPIQHAPTPD